MSRKARQYKHHDRVGRPTKFDATLIQKLEDAFINGFTDEMACLYAGIGETAFYTYCNKNPDFAKRKELLKRSPDLKAQKQLIKDLESTHGARWWAEHRMPDFMPKSKVEHSGKVQFEQTIITDPAIKEAVKQYEETRKRQIKESIESMP